MGYDKLVDSKYLDDKCAEIAQCIRLKTVWNQETKKNMKWDSDSNRYIGQDEYKVDFEDFASQIALIDRLRRMTLYPKGLDNGFIGNRVAKVAASYRYMALKEADVVGTGEDFDYNDNINVFNTQPTEDKNGNTVYSARVRNDDGLAVLDCSSFIGLVLRGIPYKNSPFTNQVYKDNPEARWVPAQEMKYGHEGWEFEIIDEQPPGEYRNTGFEGYSSIRGATQFAEFFYKYGYVVYDFSRDGKATKDLIDVVKPGDLIFLSNFDSNGNLISARRDTNTFRAVHHIGIAAERQGYWYHVTPSKSDPDNEIGVVYAKWTSNLGTISLICRPNYTHGGLSAEIPLNKNLLGFPWRGTGLSVTSYGVTATAAGDDGERLEITGTRTGTAASNTLTLVGDISTKKETLRLSAGQYVLHAISPYTDVDIALRVRTYDGTWNTLASCTLRQHQSFEISKDVDVFVDLIFSGTDAYNCTIRPDLTRTG